MGLSSLCSFVSLREFRQRFWLEATNLMHDYITLTFWRFSGLWIEITQLDFLLIGPIIAIGSHFPDAHLH